MTDHMIPADKVQEIIDMMDTRPTHPDGTSHHSEGYNEAVCLWNKHLRAILPKPRTLADELRDMAADYDANGYPEPVSDLSVLADRAETLEKERDEARELLGLREALIAEMKEEAEQDRVSSTAEIARLRAREIPDGWRLADHPKYGRVIVTKPTPDRYGYIYYMYSTDALSVGCGWHYCDPSTLTFCDETPTPEPGHPTHLKTEEDYQNAPIGTIVQMEVPGWAHFIKDDEGCWATKGFIGYYTSESMSGTPCVVVKWGTEPIPTPEPDHIDPASCGRYTWYLVEVDGEERHGIRIDPEDFAQWNFISESGMCDSASDEEVRVIRKLTCEEMDAR